MSKRKGPPLQILLICGFVLILMGIMSFKLMNPAFEAESKAKTTAQYFIEATGHAEYTRQGKELHPTPRRQLNPESFGQYMQSIGLDQPVQILGWHDKQNQMQPREWSWRIEVQREQEKFSLLTFVRLPEEMSLSRRWRVYSLCRPEQELQAASAQMQRAEFPGKAFKRTPRMEEAIAELQSQKFNSSRLSSYRPLQWQIGTDQGNYQLEWELQPREDLGCSYTLRAFRKSPRQASAETADSGQARPPAKAQS